MTIIGTLLWLSLNIYYEARSETQNAQIAIAQVTINRSKNSNLTIEEVVLQPHQFSWTSDSRKKKGKIPNDTVAFNKCVKNALIALSTPDITGGATHFHEKRVNPSWAKDMIHTKTYGIHKYYKPKSEKEKATTMKAKQYNTAKHTKVLAKQNKNKIVKRVNI